MYERWAHDGLDLSRIRLRMLDAYLTSPSRGFDDAEHEGCFTRFVVDRILAPLAAEHRPRDWTIPPEDVTTCEEVDEALEAQPEKWSRLRHPISGEFGAEFVISEDAEGALARVRRACEAYERLLQRETPAIVSLGIGPKPYPHMAFNCGPYTAPRRADALDAARRGEPESPTPATLVAIRRPSLPTRSPRGPARFWAPTAFGLPHLGQARAKRSRGVLQTPTPPTSRFRSSIGYALRARQVDMLLDEEAASDLLEDGGFEGLAKRYEQAGHELTARRS